MRARSLVLASMTALVIGLSLLAATLTAATLTCSADAHKIKDGWVVTFHPPAGYHFNKPAGATLWAHNGEGVKESVRTVRIDPQSVTATVPTTAVAIDVKLFLCDQANTVCLPHIGSYTLKEGPLVEAAPTAENVPSLGSKTGSRASHESFPGFVVNDPDRALEQAIREKKPLLVDFYGIWCPPCNILDETVFGKERFLRATEHFVRLKLDADRDCSWSLKERYRVAGYPTVVFARPDGDEIARVTDALSLDRFLEVVREATDRLTQAPEKPGAVDREGAFRKACLAIDRQEFAAALSLLEPLAGSDRSRFGPDREIKLHEARVGLARELYREASASGPQGALQHARQTYADALRKALDLFPTTPKSLEWSMALAAVTAELKDSIARNQAFARMLKAAMTLLNDPQAQARAGLSAADLWSSVGEAQNGLGQKEAARRAFLDAAEGYGRQAASLGLDKDRARGFNLERANRLKQAGRFDEAQALYERLEASYPDEFTFYFSHATLLKEIRNLGAAEAKARQAVERSYGDNRLRAVELLGRVLKELGRTDEAARLVNSTINETKLPTDPRNRTHRYHRNLVKLSGELGRR